MKQLPFPLIIGYPPDASPAHYYWVDEEHRQRTWEGAAYVFRLPDISKLWRQ